jgi:hypothetical protein
MGVDIRALQAWIDDLEHADEVLVDRTERVVGKGMFNIKKDWQARWTGHAHIPHLPRAIRYDVTTSSDVVNGDVYVDEHKRQGPLGAIIAWGLGDNAPLPGPLEAIAAEEPRFERALADMLEDLLS